MSDLGKALGAIRDTYLRTIFDEAGSLKAAYEAGYEAGHLTVERNLGDIGWLLCQRAGLADDWSHFHAGYEAAREIALDIREIEARG